MTCPELRISASFKAKLKLDIDFDHFSRRPVAPNIFKTRVVKLFDELLDHLHPTKGPNILHRQSAQTHRFSCRCDDHTLYRLGLRRLDFSVHFCNASSSDSDDAAVILLVIAMKRKSEQKRRGEASGLDSLICSPKVYT